MKKMYTLLAFITGTACAVAQNTVVFQVDMSAETVSANGVHVAGSFQAAAGFPGDWDPATSELTDGDGDGIYTLSVSLPAGSYEYKFVNGNAWGSDEGVPSGCATNNNRTLTVAGNTTIPVVCYASCSPCPAGPVPTYDITFRVDMSNTCAYDSVDIAGTVNGWSGGDLLTDGDGDGVYEITMSVDSGEVQYKFRAYSNGNANWEGIANRIHQATADITLPVTCFNATTPCVPAPAPSDITFYVDLTNEVPAANVYVMGDFTSPAWQSGAIELDPVPGQPGFYQATVTDLCPATIYYKFVNGDPAVTANEESFAGQTDTSCVEPSGVGGFNRVYTRVSADPVTLGYVFSTCSAVMGTEEFASRTFALFPNPAKHAVTISLGEETYELRLMDLTGKTVAAYPAASGELRLDVASLRSGMYIVQIRNARGEVNNSKFVVE